MDDFYDCKFWDFLFSEKLNDKEQKLFEQGKLGDGYILPTEFANEVREEMKKWNLFREHGTVMRYYEPVDNLASGLPSLHCPQKIDVGIDQTLKRRYFPTTNTWTQSTHLDSDDESNNIYWDFEIGSHKMESTIRVDRGFFEDSSFDLKRFLIREIAQSMGIAEEYAILNGKCKTLPQGISYLNEIPVTSDDYWLKASDILSLTVDVSPEHYHQSKWVIDEYTASKLREHSSWAWGANDTLFGKPAILTAQTPQSYANVIPVLFGDLSFVWIFERQPMTIKFTKDDFKKDNAVGFIVTTKMDAILADQFAVQSLRFRKSGDDDGYGY
jgi:HK97 family phage major capsid protein